MQALILAGGRATRLQPLCKNIPKSLLPIGNHPFIAYQLKQLSINGILDIIVSIGHLGNKIIDYFTDANQWGINIQFCKEEKPLGTAGAIRLAAPLLKENFMVLNGDSLSQLPFNEFIQSHRIALERWQDYLGTIALMEKSKESRYGSVIMDDNRLILSFKEKEIIPGRENFFNRGIYIFKKSIIEYIPADCNFSLEEELIPFLLKSSIKFGGFKNNGFFIDIGTIQSYREAEELYKEHKLPDIFY